MAAYCVAKRSLVTVVVLSFALLLSGHAALDNGDFTAGLSGWKAAWHVTETDGEAVLSDAQAAHAFIFQADDPGAGPFTIEFDFQNNLSTDVPDGTFNDSFYASIYYVDELSGFITEHDQFDAAQGLFDCDANGNFNINGTLSASSKGADWSHFSGTFSSAHTYVVVIFELYDLNFVQGDSSVFIDNVTITTGGTP